MKIKTIIATFLFLLSFTSASAFMINVQSSSTSPSTGVNSTYFTNSSAEVILFRDSFNTLNFESGDSLTAGTDEGTFGYSSEGGFQWSIDDDSTFVPNNPYIYMRAIDIFDGAVDVTIPILSGITNFGQGLIGLQPTLYVVGVDETIFGSILLTTNNYTTSGGTDNRLTTIGVTESTNETYIKTNFGAIRLQPLAGEASYSDQNFIAEKNLTVEEDLHARTDTQIQFFSEVASGRAVPFGACGSYFWGEAQSMRTYYEYRTKTWQGSNSAVSYGTPIPCNGTITKVSGNHITYDYNNTGNVDIAYLNVSVKVDSTYTYYGQYVDQGLGTNNYVLKGSLDVIEGEYINILHNMSALGTGVSANNDYCINKISTVVTLQCEQ